MHHASEETNSQATLQGSTGGLHCERRSKNEKRLDEPGALSGRRRRRKHFAGKCLRIARAKTRQAHPASRHKNSRQGQVHICGRCVDFAFAAILQFRREHPILCGITWWPHNWPEYVRIDKPSGCGRQHQGAEPREPPTTMLGGVVRHDHMIAAAVTHGEIGDHYAAHFGTAPRYVCENAAVVRMVRSRGANIARAHHLRTRGW